MIDVISRPFAQPVASSSFSLQSHRNLTRNKISQPYSKYIDTFHCFRKPILGITNPRLARSTISASKLCVSCRVRSSSCDNVLVKEVVGDYFQVFVEDGSEVSGILQEKKSIIPVELVQQPLNTRFKGALHREDLVLHPLVNLGHEYSEGITVASSLKEEHELDEHFVRLPTTSLEPPSPSPQGPGPGEKSKNFYANAGDAIRTLRRELPLVFVEDLTYEIYREDIVFRDPRNTFSGMKNYKLIFKTLRAFGRIFFQPGSLRVEILRIWQPIEEKIVVRWCIKGISWLPFSKDGQFDATSEFKLDREGKIYEHKVDNKTMGNDGYLSIFSKMLNMKVAQQPTPSFYSKLLPNKFTDAEIIEVDEDRTKTSTRTPIEVFASLFINASSKCMSS